MTLLGLVLRRLRDVGVDVDVETVADALWLAKLMSTELAIDRERRSGRVQPDDETTKIEADRKRSGGIANADRSIQSDGLQDAEREGIYDVISSDAPGSVRATAAYVRRARALTQPLNVARALRPLKQTLPDRRRLELDVEATVRAYADAQVLIPVFQPMPARWLHLDFIVDSAPSMLVWQELANELVELVRQLGAFRLIRVWRLDLSHGKPTLLNTRGQAGKPALLRDPYARHVILVLSDCVTEGWYKPAIWTTLREWGTSTPTVLLNPLPIRLWRHTALNAPPARLLPSLPGVRNTSLRFRASPSLQWIVGEPVAWLPLPTASLSPFSLGQWARTVMAVDAAGCDGVLVPPTGRSESELYDEDDEFDEELQSLSRTSDDLVESFRLVASPAAYKLAVLCSTQKVLSLPVLRLIQQELVPEAQVSDLAEVIIGGLFKQNPTHSPDELSLQFREGVRECLLQSLASNDAWAMHQALTRFIEREVGHGKTFPTAVADPYGELELPDELTPFAEASREILPLLGVGGSHAAVDKLSPGPESPQQPAAQREHVLPAKEYDLELEITSGGAPGAYAVTVHSPVGLESGMVRLDIPRLLSRRRELAASVLASAATTRGVVSALERPLRQTGQELFEALFSGPIAKVYRASLAEAGERNRRLRLVLQLTAPELSVLPCEALFDPVMTVYLCREELLVRHVPAPFSPEPLPVHPPLRILGLSASPRDLPALNVETEQRHLQEALAGSVAAGQVELGWLAQASWGSLQEQLLTGQWHVLHVICHSGYDLATDESRVALVDADGRADWAEATRLADLLNKAEPTPRLVVLNSCQSWETAADDLLSSTAALVHSGISAAVTMQFAVTDLAALAFAHGFYQALARSTPVDEAVRLGRIAIDSIGEQTLEWVTPVLYLRSPHGAIFDMADLPTSAEVLPAEPEPEALAKVAAALVEAGQAVEAERVARSIPDSDQQAEALAKVAAALADAGQLERATETAAEAERVARPLVSASHPSRERVAEVLVQSRGGQHRRGSGYLVTTGWVLTAAHVVADADKVAVWLGAPAKLDPGRGMGVPVDEVLMLPAADLALLPVGEQPADRVPFGRLDRNAVEPVPVVAAGYPRFTLRAAPDRPGVEQRELHLAAGTIAPVSDVKTGTLEFAVHLVPGEDSEPHRYSPWEGIAGAAVWASGRLIGVVSQHHPRKGRGVLTVRPLTAVFDASPEAVVQWRRVLPQLGTTADDLTRVATVRFGYDGRDYEIELSEEHAAELDEFLAP